MISRHFTRQILLASGCSEVTVFYPQKLNAYLRSGYLIVDRVRSVLGGYICQLNAKLRQICLGRDVARTPTEHDEAPLAVVLVPHDETRAYLVGWYEWIIGS